MKLKLFSWPRLPQTSERRPMVEQCRADDSELCREAVAQGWLTREQMARAAERYRLGKSRSGKTIFWMIDERGICRDGHIGCESAAADTWVSQMLKQRYPENAQYVVPRHCLFGLHLLEAAGGDVAVVESERSAVVLSELLPERIWMAAAYPANLTVDRLEPLKGRTVTLFPRTDPCMANYISWLETAETARELYQLDISVSDCLERHCSEEQKEQETDLLEFILDSD